MSNLYKFEVGQIVFVDEIKCRIDAREMFDNEPDYLCIPVEPFEGYTSQGNELAGWIRTNNIKETSNE